MKIRTLKDLGFDGKHTPAGSIVECPPTLARELITGNRAVAVADELPAEVKTETEGATPFPEEEETGTDEPAKPVIPQPKPSTRSGK